MKRNIILFFIFSLSIFGCKTVKVPFLEKNFYFDDAKIESQSLKKEGTDKLVSSEYQTFVKKSPHKLDPTAEVYIEANNRYSYETEIVNTMKKKKNWICKLTTFAGGTTLSGGLLLYQKSNIGGGFLIGVGLISFLTSTFLPNEISSQSKAEGAIEYFNKKIPIAQNTEIAVKTGNLEKIFKTNHSGHLRFDMIYDFSLRKFDAKTDVSFTLFKDKTILKTYKGDNFITFSSTLWTQEFAKVMKDNAILKNPLTQRNIGPTFLGKTFVVKSFRTQSNEYEVETDDATALIHKNSVEHFFAYSENPQQILSSAESVKEYVNIKMKEWLKKWEFEKKDAYLQRISKKDSMKIAFADEAMKLYQKDYVNRINWKNVSISNYDADNETFKLTFPSVAEIVVKIPYANAVSFKQNFSLLRIENPEFKLVNGQWELFHLEFFSPSDSFETIYQRTDNIDYQPFNPKIQDIPENNQNQNLLLTDNYNIESNFPATQENNPDAIAVVIGNTKYTYAKSVDFADEDAILIKKYLIQVLGFRETNIFFKINATKSDFELFFGTENNEKGRLYNAVKPEKSDIFIFYSGHGAPDLKNGKGFFVPVECEPTYLEIQGYSLELFYKNITKIPARKKTVIIDACFSGADIYNNISPLVIKIRDELIYAKNTAVLSSSAAKQVSTWFPAKKHGLFTYFFLKAIHQHSVSDKNSDNKLSYQEIFDYISDNTEGIPYWARRLHGIEQNPTLQGTMNNEIFIRYK